MKDNPCPNKDFWVFRHDKSEFLAKWCPVCNHWGLQYSSNKDNTFHQWSLLKSLEEVLESFADWEMIEGPSVNLFYLPPPFVVTRLY